MTSEGFHEGELAVQTRAGVRTQAARLGTAMLSVPDLKGGISSFLAERDFAVITARDADGRLWTSPLLGQPGFLEARDRTLTVHTVADPGDPLHALGADQPVGMLVIDFATRRRVRVNGTLTDTGAEELLITVDQAFGNCPKYIQQRQLAPTDGGDASITPIRSTTFGGEDAALIAAADTFFLGTVHPTRGADASHRGGPPGFVRVDRGTLWWPDSPGNNMFNSFGNLAVDDSAALLFVDFDTGASLHLSGSAVVEWTAHGVRGDDGGTGRRVRFTPESVVSGHRLRIHGGPPRPSPHNPPTT